MATMAGRPKADQRSWPFVGRAEQLDRLARQLGDGTHLVLSGAAGLGKSRLAVELGHRFSADGVAVHRIVASPAGTPVPLAPFAALVGDAIGGDAVNAARRALGADGKAGAGDPVLVVDDLHLLDDASATVLHQLLAAGGLRMVATLRSSAAAPAAVDRVRLAPGVVHEALNPLADDEIVAMVEAALGAPLAGHARQVIVSTSAGNPMYARELVEGSLAAGAMQRHGGVYGFERDIVATPLLEEVVLARLAPLPPEQRTALELLAVGGRLPQQLVESVVGFAPLEALERDGVLVSETEARSIVLDVAHPLYRELTRARLGSLSRMRINRTLAEADASTSSAALQKRAADEQLRAVVWAVRGGMPIDHTVVLSAARRAADAGDSPLAAELAEEAYRGNASTEAALMASWCVATMGQHDQAIEFLRNALACETDPWARAAMRLRIAEEYWWTGRTTQGEAVLAEGDRDPGPWTALLDAQRGVHALLSGDVGRAVTQCAPLVQHPHPWVRFVAVIGLTLADIYGDRCDDALATSTAFTDGLGDVDTALLGDPKQHLAIQLIALMQGGDVPTAVAFAAAAYDDTRRLPGPQARAWAAMLLGMASELAGSLQQATRVLAEAERTWASVGAEGCAVWCAAGLARAQVSRGALDEAADTLARAERYQRPGFMLNEHLLDIARAWVAHAAGERESAAAALRHAVQRTAALGQHTNLAETWHEVARLGLLDLVVPDGAFTRGASPLAAARHDMVRACAANDAAAVEAAAVAFEQLGAVVYAAEAAAAAAAIHRRAGAGKDALRLDGLAGALAARAGGASTPLLAGRSGAGPLSARETEIARLAADGLTNRQIADRLYVSERTVENHLYRVFIKLGVSGRDGLAPALTG